MKTEIESPTGSSAPDVTATTATSSAAAPASERPLMAGRGARTLSIRLSTVATAVAAVAAAVAIVTLSVLWLSSRSELSDRAARDADQRHAEQVATDYAVGAATVNYQDAGSWLTRLKANTAPALANKFDATAPKLQEVLGPLQWNSTAQPVAARAISESAGVYKVDVFVTVTSTNAQSPQGGQTTVTYTVTVDRGADWKITDVGGMDGALRAK
ncbi:hypothetical protein [Nocardia sp. NPDC006630]|uniref:hypothetical protein n=1 Tax=Nocardia sp. NPDC006630 TaxID=3157181 RepID=UPI0033B224E9